ncbi:hypothetical protein PUN28_002767 [Cardiocondyla obscurior]|uniref:Uncharacterized protein n=1 Tax=Cardiocondyla obscurior TaxID=286306 RepID=A0AAW2GW09_9HYME
MRRVQEKLEQQESYFHYDVDEEKLKASHSRHPERRRRPRKGIRHRRSNSKILYVQCAEGWLDTSHLRGGAGPGRVSCIGGATFSHRQNSSTPLLMQSVTNKTLQLR